jgi:hypothetical protein
MKRIFLTLIFFLILVATTFAGSAVLTWTPPTTNTDGTPITNLQGYKVYYGTTMGGAYPNSLTIANPSATTTTITGLASGDWYFVATAYKTAVSGGLESVYSNEVKKSVAEVAPNAPGNLR